MLFVQSCEELVCLLDFLQDSLLVKKSEVHGSTGSQMFIINVNKG